MIEHYINYNPTKQTPREGFCKHNVFDNARREAVSLMKKEKTEIYIYKLIGVIKPVEDYIFEEADTLPF
jgi:hypothetical protein